MATFTENYNLIKPGEEDYYDVNDFNENMDTIDTVMATVETAADTISEKIGTAEDTGNTTVFGKLNKMASGGSGLTSIKSIQSFTVSLATNYGSVTQEITPVVPENCIVLMDRFFDGTSIKTWLDYTLNANNLSVVTTGGTVGTVTLRFQIIEFC